MTNALTPEQLGEVGESLFAKLCAQAGLICNKSLRDMTGWDFRVELPMDMESGAALDQRAPRVCQIQLKSTAGESGTRVSARLSSIERLAKDASPAAVIVFRMRPDGTELRGYAIPLIDNPLGRVLHRLRQAQANARLDVNHLDISFDYLMGVPFRPDAAGLRDALAAIAPEDVAGYALRKRHQLDSLGYPDGGGLEANILVRVESADHLSRMLTGRAPLQPVAMQRFDRRFGIRIPYDGPMLDDVEEFSIDLPRVGPCEIVIRGGPLLPAAVFPCEAHVPPPIADGTILVMKHPMLSAIFSHAGVNIETVGNFTVSRLTHGEWLLLLRALTYLTSGNGTFEMEFRGTRLSPAPIPAGAVDGPYTEELPRMLSFVASLARSLEVAGVSLADPFSLDDIFAADDAQMSLDMMLNPNPFARLEFEYDPSGGLFEAERLPALYFNSFAFAGVTVSFATRVILARAVCDPPMYVSERFELLDIRPGVTDLDAYGAEQARVNAIENLIDPAGLIKVNRSRAIS